MPSILKDIASNIERISRVKGISTVDVAVRARIPLETLLSVLRGEQSASVGLIERLAKVLGVTEARLLRRPKGSKGLKRSARRLSKTGRTKAR